MLKITHAAGHALVTAGKQSPDGYKEWQYTSEIVKLIIAELANYEGVAQKRVDDPTGKTDYSLSKRASESDAFSAHIHIDHHLNAWGNGSWDDANGTETYVRTSKPKESVTLATKVQENLVKELGFRDRKVKYVDFTMVTLPKAPVKILIEYAFMTNKDEAMKMRTADYQKKAAKAVVDALVTQYKLKKKVVQSSVTSSTTSSSKKLYKVQVGAFSVKANAETLASELKSKGYATYIVEQ